MKPKHWYETNLAIISLLFLFCPLGLYLMFQHSKWSNRTKGLVVVILFIWLFSKSSTNNQQTAQTYQGCLEEAKQFNRKHMASFAHASECYQYKNRR